jgi:lipid II isoglutaminyl synthase (glutamine-hydrolysing)
MSGTLTAGPRHRKTPAQAPAKARFTLAVAAGKAAGAASRALGRGGGTSFPGAVARRIDPHVLRKVAAVSNASTVVVTGSNGKTTTCRMLAALAEAGGLTVAQNRSGSNLLQGVISAAVRDADLLGRMDAELLLLEVDEATVRRVVPEMQPDIFVVTNIFRDQLDRFGELYSMARMLQAVVHALPASATVILNADDPLVASLPDGTGAALTETGTGETGTGETSTGDTGRGARVVYYGIADGGAGRKVPEHSADTIRCVRCQHTLTYRAVHLSHLGDYSCPACGASRPTLDVAVSAIRPSPGGGSDITIETPTGPVPLHVPLAGVHNVYNAAAALACVTALSLPGPLEPAQAHQAMAGVRPAFGRLEEIRAGDRQVTLAFVKNPTSYNTTLREVLLRPGRKHVLAAHSNTVVDGEDFAWLWDVDIEALVPQLASLTVSGTRAEEVALRFKYAGADPALIRVVPDRAAALQEALTQPTAGEALHIFAGYTPMRELRGVMQRRGWVSPAWQE